MLFDKENLEKIQYSILLVAVYYIGNSLDSGKVVCAPFLDLRKANDSLDHCIL